MLVSLTKEKGKKKKLREEKKKCESEEKLRKEKEDNYLKEKNHSGCSCTSKNQERKSESSGKLSKEAKG